MRFSVPQFIELEDKVFGPLTFKQGIFVVGGIAGPVVLFVQFGLLLAILIGLPFATLAFLLAFVKVHERPFVHILSSAFFYILKNKLYLWKKVPRKSHTDETAKNTNSIHTTQTVTLDRSGLKNLAASLDTNFDKKNSS